MKPTQALEVHEFQPSSFLKPHKNCTIQNQNQTLMMKPFSHIQLISFLALLSFTLLLLSPTLSSSSHLSITTHHLLPLLLFFTFCALLFLLHHLFIRPPPILLLNYSCFKPPPHRKCTYEVSERFMRGSAVLTPKSMEFMRDIYLKSGLGDETYAPSFIFTPPYNPTLKCAIQEAQEGMFSAVDSLLSKTQISTSLIDVVVVTCGCFSPSPSLSSQIVNHYKLKPDVKTYNLSGMGCSSGVLAIDLAARVLRGGKKVQYALVIISECITLNWYRGDKRSMLLPNSIFRVGCAAAMITNDASRRRVAKMELVDSLRTHHGADDGAYCAVLQEEDNEGTTGISVTKDLIRVAGVNLREHIKLLAPRVLPLSQLVRCAYSMAAAALSGDESNPVVPNFTKAFQHLCIHTGGKAVIEQVGRVMHLAEEVTEPARMCLHRFGNTSSSLVFYELAYFERKERVKRGDRMWMLAFGTGFKVGSLVWKWLSESCKDSDNPWNDCIDAYPLEVW